MTRPMKRADTQGSGLTRERYCSMCEEADICHDLGCAHGSAAAWASPDLRDKTDAEATASDLLTELARLRVQNEKLVEAAQSVMGHIVGKLPNQGRYRDNIHSRDALDRLRSALELRETGPA